VNIVTIDFETYYDKDYSLKKMTTEAYIRSPLFQVIGVGVKYNNYDADWYCGYNPEGFLKSLDFSKCAVLCHNTMFDGAILSWKYGIKPKLWLDTLSMARPLHGAVVGGSLDALTTYYGLGKKGNEVVNAMGKRRSEFSEQELMDYGAYCTNDVELTYKLFKKLKQGFPVSELMVIDQTIRMYTEPTIELSKPLLEEHYKDVIKRKNELIISLPGGENSIQLLMSNDKFAQRLQMLGVDPPTKISPRTGKSTWAFSKTDKGMTDLLDHPDPQVQMLVAARLGTKSTIEETRTQAFIGIAERGRLPIMLNYYGAHTGRFSGGDKINLQNLPARGNNKIRQALRAPEYHKIIACDSSQIEARMVAWLAGQEDLVQAFREKRDVYSEFATEVYGRTITKADKVERFVGKTCVLGLGYGMGAEKFRRTLEIGQAGISVKIDTNEAERIVRLYRQKNWKIVELWQRCGYALQGILNGGSGTINKCIDYDCEGIILPNGFKLRYTALRANGNGFEYIADARTYKKYLASKLGGGAPVKLDWTKIYGGKVVENIVQALAALVIREQMAKVGQKYKVAFQVHDEIIITAGAADADHAERYLVECMSTPPAWAADLPVACESGQADNYGDT
jgi:DNA polymerase I-like protein with 3'-5' exonuclease and polymerase domains